MSREFPIALINLRRLQCCNDNWEQILQQLAGIYMVHSDATDPCDEMTDPCDEQIFGMMVRASMGRRT
jgi:hypothetical protein